MSEENRFLSLIRLPDECDAQQCAELLARESDLDLASVRMQLKREPPMIYGRVPSATAKRAVDAIVRHGGDAFAPSLADIESLGATLKIKNIRIVPEGLLFELWRGQPHIVAPSDIEVIVRASISDRFRRSLRSAFLDLPLPAAASGTGFGLSGVNPVWATRRHARLMYEHMRTMDQSVSASHKLDIHTRDAVFQIDGDKFGYGILGDLRSHGDNANVDRMVELFVHLNSETIVDEFFSLWSPPTGHDQLRLPLMHVNKDDPAFAFYSRWTTMMYRHVTS